MQLWIIKWLSKKGGNKSRCTVLQYLQHLQRLKSNVLSVHIPRHADHFDCRKILLSDPTEEEENLSSGTIHFVVTGEELCSVHKPGGSPLSDEQFVKCIQLSKEHSAYVVKLINTAINCMK